MTEEKLVASVVDYFDTKIFKNHISASINKNAKLKSYKINPILVKYLSHVLEKNYTPIGVAKALFYPRVLSTSITTSFGSKIQKMFVELGIAKGSMIQGMDIEFRDHIDGREKWCQLKAGPNTINHDDVKPLIQKFTKTINLARTNDAFKGISNNDFIVAVLYGEEKDLSQHYQKINNIHPVIVGRDFWHRVTGFPNFYEKLVVQLHKKIETIDTKDLINVGCAKLAKEVEVSPLFDFT